MVSAATSSPAKNPAEGAERAVTTRWHDCATREIFEAEACRRILSAAQDALTARGTFRIVLAGGATPRGVYARLRAADTDWSAWHVYFGDERCLPAGHPERNDTMARQAWLAHVPLPPHKYHAIPAELGAEAAAERYAATLRDVGAFDLVVLGLGQDGHTASLFPGQAWRQATAWPDAFAVHDAPKPPPDRVTLSPTRLSRTRACLFLVTGADKADAVTAWRAGAAIPAACIDAEAGVDVMTLGIAMDTDTRGHRHAP